jgi:hypothetical protein
VISRKNSSLKTISFSKPPGSISLIRITRIPDARVAHEIESSLMHHGGSLALGVRAKEYRRAEYPLESRNQTAILGTALLHSKYVQHFVRAPEGDGLLLLAHGQCREEDGNQSVLSPRHSVRRMTGHLQKKLTVPALVQQDSFGRSFDRQPAQNERSRGEAETLVHVVALQPHELNRFSLPKFRKRTGRTI